LKKKMIMSRSRQAGPLLKNSLKMLGFFGRAYGNSPWQQDAMGVSTADGNSSVTT
jgi:hypothetical protein